MQQIFARCGIPGNETIDKLAKVLEEGSKKQQYNYSTTYNEATIIIKNSQKNKWNVQHPEHNSEDSYYQLTRAKQVIIKVFLWRKAVFFTFMVQIISIFRILVKSGRSFINITNRSGPSTDT